MPKDLTQEEAFERAVNFSERYVKRGPYEFFPEAEVVRVRTGGAGRDEVNYRYPPTALECHSAAIRSRIARRYAPCERHHEDIERDGFCI